MIYLYLLSKLLCANCTAPISRHSFSADKSPAMSTFSQIRCCCCHHHCCCWCWCWCCWCCFCCWCCCWCTCIYHCCGRRPRCCCCCCFRLRRCVVVVVADIVIVPGTVSRYRYRYLVTRRHLLSTERKCTSVINFVLYVKKLLSMLLYVGIYEHTVGKRGQRG